MKEYGITAETTSTGTRTIMTRADEIFNKIMTGIWEAASSSGEHDLEPGYYCKTKGINKKGEACLFYVHSNILSYTNRFERYCSKQPVERIKRICKAFSVWTFMDASDLEYLYNN